MSEKTELKNYFFPDKTCSHIINRTQKFFDEENLDHSSYSPDLAPNDYHLYSAMKTWFVTQRFHSNAKLQVGINQWLRSQTVDFFKVRIEKRVSYYDKCINLNKDYVEK